MRTDTILSMDGMIQALIDQADRIEESLEQSFNEIEKGKVSAYRNALQAMVLMDLNESNVLSHIIFGLTKEVSRREALYQTDWNNLHPDFVLGELLGYRIVLDSLVSFRNEIERRQKQLNQQQQKEAAEWEKFLEEKGLKK